MCLAGLLAQTHLHTFNLHFGMCVDTRLWYFDEYIRQMCIIQAETYIVSPNNGLQIYLCQRSNEAHSFRKKTRLACRVMMYHHKPNNRDCKQCKSWFFHLEKKNRNKTPGYKVHRHMRDTSNQWSTMLLALMSIVLMCFSRGCVTEFNYLYEPLKYKLIMYWTFSFIGDHVTWLA